MRAFNLFICLVLIVMLVWMTQATGSESGSSTYGGLSWIGWASVTTIVLVAGIVFIFNDSVRAYGLFRRLQGRVAERDEVRTLTSPELGELGLEKYRGPEYPHPVVFPERCIGCQACVDACPHDVLAIVDGIAAAVAPDLCMEDTACQAECPVNPKAVIVVNTAKPIVSRPAPTRDGSSYQTNVPGCYIIGDVSGVPLIKNAVKEGYEVIEHIAAGLMHASPEPKADHDVAIIGVGSGGASAAAAAQEKQLRYVAIEQDKKLSTIDAYPKGKYIFFKPDSKDWFGGLPVAGLGLGKSKYDTSSRDGYVFETGSAEMEKAIGEQTSSLLDEIDLRIPASLRSGLRPLLREKIDAELRSRIPASLKAGTAAELNEKLPDVRRDIVEQVVGRVPGDQRENILQLWLSWLDEKGVKVNEFESCKSITPADDGDYFLITTERREGKSTLSYRARRVVIAIGLRGAPNRLRLANEDMRVVIDDREIPKVLYSLTNPADFRGRKIVIVGGGNVAVEAAVDLVTNRVGTGIEPRPANERNDVTLLVRTSLAPTVKFGNKFQLYQCADAGLLDLRFGVAIREMRGHELVLEDVMTGNELETIANDFVFALIGGERPDRFLQSVGITVT